MSSSSTPPSSPARSSAFAIRRSGTRASRRSRRALGVAHLDLLEAFEREPAASFEVGAFDARPNERAQALAAERILAAADELLAAPSNAPSGGRGSAPRGR